MGDHGTHLVKGGDVHADLELAFLTLVRLTLLATSAPGAQAAHDVLCDQAAFLSIGEGGAERSENPANHRWRIIGPESVLEAAHHGHGELRQPDPTDYWNDVKG